jgi:ligand-binding SRPBCC domain-containing protein
MYFELTDRFVVAADLTRTWDFFSRTDNLPLITPPWLGFTVRSAGPATITRDMLLDYTIRWLGIPVKWRTRIIDVDPRRQFIDLQVKGPYALWLHQHQFAETREGVECSDRVVYRLPVPLAGRLVHAAVVRRQLLDIFRFRRKVITEKLGWVRAVQDDVKICPLH